MIEGQVVSKIEFLPSLVIMSVSISYLLMPMFNLARSFFHVYLFVFIAGHSLLCARICLFVS